MDGREICRLADKINKRDELNEKTENDDVQESVQLCNTRDRLLRAVADWFDRVKDEYTIDDGIPVGELKLEAVRDSGDLYIYVTETKGIVAI